MRGVPASSAQAETRRSSNGTPQVLTASTAATMAGLLWSGHRIGALQGVGAGRGKSPVSCCAGRCWPRSFTIFDWAAEAVVRAAFQFPAVPAQIAQIAATAVRPRLAGLRIARMTLTRSRDPARRGCRDQALRHALPCRWQSDAPRTRLVGTKTAPRMAIQASAGWATDGAAGRGGQHGVAVPGDADLAPGCQRDADGTWRRYAKRPGRRVRGRPQGRPAGPAAAHAQAAAGRRAARHRGQPRVLAWPVRDQPRVL